MLHHSIPRILGIFLVILLTSGCFVRTPDLAPGSQSSSTGRPVPPKVGNVAWDFALNTLEGEQIRLSDLRGKQVMLNFWATWCGPCRVEIPAMVALYEEMHGDGLEVLAINLREDPEKVQSFAQELNMSFPVLLDTAGKVSQAYYVRGIPTTIFVDEEGIIRVVHVGTLTDRTLRDYVKRMAK